MALIEYRNVHKAFNGQQVLDGVDLSIEEGVVTSIVGRSGVGKSVMLKHVVGLLEADSGEVCYQGDDVMRMSRKERRALRRSISYMFQNMALFDSMTCFENIALPLQEKTRMKRAEIRDAVMNRLSQLDLEGIAAKYPSEISGGMQKRVALARALITDPEIVLFDEPTTGLDPVRKYAVYEMIGRYQNEFGFTAAIVTHDIPDVFYISQKIAMLDDGKIIFEGTPEEMQSCDDQRVREFIEPGADAA